MSASGIVLTDHIDYAVCKASERPEQRAEAGWAGRRGGSRATAAAAVTHTMMWSVMNTITGRGGGGLDWTTKKYNCAHALKDGRGCC